MVYECDCGQTGTLNFYLAVIKKLCCPLCCSELKIKNEFSLSFWVKHQSFKDLDEDFLHPKRKAVLDAIKICQPCSDRDLSVFLNQPINRITPRRNELANCSIPFIVAIDKKLDSETKRFVTLWGVNKDLNDVERFLEVKQCV